MARARKHQAKQTYAHPTTAGEQTKSANTHTVYGCGHMAHIYVPTSSMFARARKMHSISSVSLNKWEAFNLW